MAFRTTGLIKRLSWTEFFRLLVHLPSFLKLFCRLVEDPRVSAGAKLVLVGILGYVILPMDVVPDFLPGMGQLDDLAVVAGGLKLFLRLCPPEVVREQVRSIGGGD